MVSEKRGHADVGKGFWLLNFPNCHHRINRKIQVLITFHGDGCRYPVMCFSSMLP